MHVICEQIQELEGNIYPRGNYMIYVDMNYVIGGLPQGNDTFGAFIRKITRWWVSFCHTLVLLE